MIKKLIISFVVAISVTTFVSVITISHTYNADVLTNSINSVGPGAFNQMEIICTTTPKYTVKGFPFPESQIVAHDECSTTYQHNYRIQPIIMNIIFWFVITFGLIEGYSLVRKRLSVGKTNQSIKK
jgi:hypothetical protein